MLTVTILLNKIKLYVHWLSIYKAYYKAYLSRG